MKNHDFVIHFAAESHVDRSIDDGSAFMRTNVLGTYNVLEASRKSGIMTIIHVSTDEVYGSLESGSATEINQLKPNSPYAASKASSDLIARSYYKTYGLDVRVTRCTNNYGPNQFPEKLIPLMLSNIKAGKPLPVYGTGMNIREWIHVSDHCRAIQLVIQNGKPGEVYNIGSGDEVSNLEIVKMLLRIGGITENMIDFVPDRLGHDFRYSVDCAKIKKLGFKPNIPIESGLMETARYYLD
jgi:dTDP-glucose 4,6-dehydratase